MGVPETVHRMMKDRHMTPVTSGETLEEMKQSPIFFSLYEPTECAPESTKTMGDVAVFFFKESLDADAARVAMGLMENHKIKKAVAVSFAQVTPIGRKELLNCSGRVIQLFTSDALERPFVDHSLIPRHELFLGELPKTFTENQLSRISDADVVVRWYDWNAGDIVKITKVYGDLPAQVNLFKVVSSMTLPIKKQKKPKEDKGCKR